MFIKRGDGKIISVFKEEDLDEQQKKAVKDAKNQVKKESNTELKDKKSEV